MFNLFLIPGNLFKVDVSDADMKVLEKTLSFVRKGGWYKPTNCTCHSDKKVDFP